MIGSISVKKNGSLLKRLSMFAVAVIIAATGFIFPAKPVHATASDHTYGYQIGTPAYGQNPEKIAAGIDGSVYTYDSSRNEIVRFADDGSILKRLKVSNIINGHINALSVGLDGNIYAGTYDKLYVITPDGETVRSFSLSSYPKGIAVDSSGSVYVTQTNQVVVYDSLCNQVQSWGSSSANSADGRFNNPLGLAIYNNEVYVADQNNHRVQVFSMTGTDIPA